MMNYFDSNETSIKSKIYKQLMHNKFVFSIVIFVPLWSNCDILNNIYKFWNIISRSYRNLNSPPTCEGIREKKSKICHVKYGAWPPLILKHTQSVVLNKLWWFKIRLDLVNGCLQKITFVYYITTCITTLSAR